MSYLYILSSNFRSSGWIHVIFIHLIKQLQKFWLDPCHIYTSYQTTSEVLVGSMSYLYILSSNFRSSGWIHVIFIHLIKQLQKFWLDPCHIYTSYQATSEVLVGSMSYLYILSSNFRRCVACKVSAKFKNSNFWQFFKIGNFDFVLFWLGIRCESLVWVIMGRRGVSQNVSVLVVLVTAILHYIYVYQQICILICINTENYAAHKFVW